MKFRIGHGYDIHRLEDDSTEVGLVLGGITIAYHKKFIAHSDGDVVIHAVIDSILGAAGLGDIGQHFPDTDPKYKNISSKILLTETLEKIEKLDYRLNNLDITIIAQKPKLMPHLLKMREVLSGLLKVSINDVNIKAKTNENCDAVGACEAIAVFAVSTLN